MCTMHDSVTMYATVAINTDFKRGEEKNEDEDEPVRFTAYTSYEGLVIPAGTALCEVELHGDVIDLGKGVFSGTEITFVKIVR